MGELTTIQQAILVCAGRHPGRYSRSALAKLLVGSHSSRLPDQAADPDFGRLADRGRKAVTFEIDILLQQGYLAIDHHQAIIPGPHFPSGTP